MRLAILMNLAPRKLGSFEGWITAMCEKARERGASVDVYGREPVHPAFLKCLEELGVGWSTVGALEGSALSAIARLRTYDVLHLNMFAPRSRIALLAYAAIPAKVLFVDHTSGPVPSQRPTEQQPLSLLKRAADRMTMVRVSAVAGVSDYVRERNARRFGLTGNRVRTLYNGVDLSRFLPVDAALAAGKKARLKIVTVAHLIPQKGIDHLIRGLALTQRRDLELTVIGDGRELQALQGLARSSGVSDRVDFAGLRDDVHELLATCDLFVHPAVWEEAFGLTIAEAMACGRAIIASRIGGIPELIEDRVSGLLVAPGDAAGIAEALKHLADRPELREQLGKNARRAAEQRFGLERCALEHVQWCESALLTPARATGGSGDHMSRA